MATAFEAREVADAFEAAAKEAGILQMSDVLDRVGSAFVASPPRPRWYRRRRNP